jgi:uncharacterized protein (DUF1015 family)
VPEVLPFNALRYEPAAVGSLTDVTAPPYDVIEPAQRQELLRRSPFNVVEIDLPEVAEGDPYEHAAETLEAWTLQGILTSDREPALWALEQEFDDPGGARLTRHGILARVRAAPYAAGDVRPHERTQPGPKEDRLRLTRATRHNLSPIFALSARDAWPRLAPALAEPPWAEITDADRTLHRVWRVDEPSVHDAVGAELAESELLIADGHHRYETSLAYGDEVGGDGPHRYTLMCLTALDDPGLTVFPIHRLLKDLDPGAQEALADGIRAHFDLQEVGIGELDPRGEDGLGVLGYIDSHFRRAFRLRVRDRGGIDDELGDAPDAYRELDAVILETLILRGALGMTADDIEAKRGIGYANSTADALAALDQGWDCAFLLRPAPVEQVRRVAEAGQTMPPKTTYFFPKLLTGLVFNPLS